MAEYTESQPQTPKRGRDQYFEEDEDYNPLEETAFDAPTTVKTGKMPMGRPRILPIQGLEETSRATERQISDEANAIANLDKDINRLAETTWENQPFDENLREATCKRDEERDRRIKLNNDIQKAKSSKMTTEEEIR